MSRILVFAYGAVCYAVFLATFLYAIGFVGNVAVPKSLDSSPALPWPIAIMIDAALLSVFALQHSVMARPFFKRAITRWIPAAAERSTYVLASSAALLLLFWQWQPLGGVVWQVEYPLASGLLHAGFAFGWLLVLLTTFSINHFDLFGLRQVWRELRGLPQSKLAFVLPLPYRVVRHPLYVGWFFAFWCAPTMTITHFFFACVTTVYILVAIQFEEADLAAEHPEYRVYRRHVPVLIPRLLRSRVASAPAAMNDARSEPL